MIVSLMFLVSVGVFILARYVIFLRQEAAAARRRRLYYVDAVGRTGRQHGMDEILWRETGEKSKPGWYK